MVKKLLGDAVREERLRRNLSQNSLAEQAKISLRTVSDIENYIDTINKYQREGITASDDGHIGLSIDFAGEIYEKNITDTEISGIAETALNNIETELDDYGDAITAQERIALLLRLLRREIDKL